MIEKFERDFDSLAEETPGLGNVRYWSSVDIVFGAFVVTGVLLQEDIVSLEGFDFDLGFFDQFDD